MCTAHPRKGDLKEFNGLTATEEDYHDKSARAQLGAILFGDKNKHVFFSPELMFLADPDFVPSPPPSPAWRRQTKKRAQPRRKAAPPAEVLREDEEQQDGEQPAESRNMADLARLWEESEDED